MRRNLIAARQNRSMTQDDVAAIIGLSTRNYRRIESANTSGNIKRWEQLSKLFDKPIEYLAKQDTDQT